MADALDAYEPAGGGDALDTYQATAPAVDDSKLRKRNIGGFPGAGLRGEVEDREAPTGLAGLITGQTRPDVSQAESAARGGLQGTSLGFGDELAALIDTGASKVLGAPGAVRRVLGQPESPRLQQIAAALGDERLPSIANPDVTYQQRRDAYRHLNAEAQAANPKTYLASELVGSAVAPVPGGTAIKGTTLGGKIASLAGQGAKVGALAALGGSTANLAPGQPIEYLQAAKDVGKGALAGAVAAPLVAGAVGAAGKVAKALTPSAEKAIKNARGWVSKTIGGDIKGASTATARKQLADDAENVSTIVLKDRPLDKLIDHAESGNLESLQKAQEGVTERLGAIESKRLAPHWDAASKALPNGGVRSGDFVDFLGNRAEELRATGLTSDGAEADALDAIVGRIKKARDWGGGKQYDPTVKVQGGGLDGMPTGDAIKLLERQKTGPTAGAVGAQIKALRDAATVEAFNPDAIVPARQVQKQWADEAGNAYKSMGGIHGTVAFERKLDIASHLREFRDAMIADVAKVNPRVAGELRAANREYSALKRVENVLDQRINHAQANAQGASVPAGFKKVVKEIKHSPTGFALSLVPEGMIAGKRAFDKFIARRALTPRQDGALRAIFEAPAAGAAVVKAAVKAGVPTPVALWAAQAAQGGARLKNVATEEQAPPAIAETP